MFGENEVPTGVTGEARLLLVLVVVVVKDDPSLRDDSFVFFFFKKPSVGIKRACGCLSHRDALACQSGVKRRQCLEALQLADRDDQRKLCKGNRSLMELRLSWRAITLSECLNGETGSRWMSYGRSIAIIQILALEELSLSNGPQC